MELIVGIILWILICAMLYNKSSDNIKVPQKRKEQIEDNNIDKEFNVWDEVYFKEWAYWKWDFITHWKIVSIDSIDNWYSINKIYNVYCYCTSKNTNFSIVDIHKNREEAFKLEWERMASRAKNSLSYS
jgi:hypothetical protein